MTSLRLALVGWTTALLAVKSDWFLAAAMTPLLSMVTQVSSLGAQALV